MAVRKAMVALIILSVLTVGYLAINRIMVSFESTMKELAASPMQNVDLSTVPDGTYTGSFSVTPISVEVAVTVSDGSLLDIELLKHNHGRGADADVIPSRVVQAQSLDVDTVAGATYSSQVILKAIEDALVSAGR